MKRVLAIAAANRRRAHRRRGARCRRARRVWVAGTESGLQFVWQRVAQRLPDGIAIEALEGRLSGPLVLSGVELRTQTLQLRIERAELEWRPLGLLEESLGIDRLHVRGVDVVQFPSDGRAAGSPIESRRCRERIELPFDIEVANASLEELRYRSHPEGEPLLIERVDLAARLDRDELGDPGLSVHGPLFDVDGASETRAARRLRNRRTTGLGAAARQIIPTSTAARDCPVTCTRSRSSSASKRRTTRARKCACGSRSLRSASTAR